MDYKIPETVNISVLDAKLRQRFGERILGVSSTPLRIHFKDDTPPTLDEKQIICDIIKSLDKLDSWESSNFRNLTIDQINSRIATVQSQIDAVTNVATAKTALNSMYADMQKMARIIIWLLKREMNEI